MVTIAEFHRIMQPLASGRPIFQSEADFQHALAWLIHEQYPRCSMRLEVNPYADGKRAHLDILCVIDGQPIAIELKYKTRELDVSYGVEDYHLRGHSALDFGRYDFINDIGRLERFVSTNERSCETSPRMVYKSWQ